ncbi:hypothetical protein BBJ28_00015200 [Nothophytophthora sp. Chile5]|nr:hypothetical protein BBJ28_00015200 [Nothophytophthora sp. Chile5]
MSALRDVGVVLSCFARFGGVAYCLMQAADTIKCVGPSMLPTLNRDGDIVLLDKLSPRLWKLQPGEVVIAKSVSNPKQTVCKRIIAQIWPVNQVKWMKKEIAPQAFRER